MDGLMFSGEGYRHIQKAVANTKELLSRISNHLSGRRDCKNVEYWVIVDRDNVITFYPDIQVLRTRYDRKYKQNILVHVLEMHMPGSVNHIESELVGRVISFPNWFVPGTYRYRNSSTRRYRRWEKE